MAQSGSVATPALEADRLEATGDLAGALAAAPSVSWRAYLASKIGVPDAADVGEGAAQDEEDRALLHLARGWASFAAGEVATALLSFEEAALASAPPRLRLRGLLAAAELLVGRAGPGDAERADAHLRAAEALLEEADARDFRLGCRLVRAAWRALHGDLDGAIAEAEDVAVEAERADLDVHWRVEALLARLHARRGSDFVARRHEQAAVESLEELVVTLPAPLRTVFWRDPRRRAVRMAASSTTQRRLAAQVPSAAGGLDSRTHRLLDLLKRLASEHDVDRLLERITDAAVELSGAERGFVLLPDEAGGLVPRLVRGTAPDDPSVAFSRSIAEAVLIDGEPLVTVDAQGDRRLTEYLTVHRLRLRSVACLPIRGPGGTVGVIYLEHRLRRGRFAEEELDLLLAFADQAAIALENARLVAELGARTAELADANEELARAKAEIERVLVARTEELEQTKRDLDRTRSQLRGSFRHGGIIGRSEPMRRVFALIERVQETDVPVVIQGESGTGKELVARAIHYGGPRAKKPFLALNCAAIPEALLESELFGYVRGAFTGAAKDRQGVLERASGGTLFLDEVGDMPPKMQVDLLRVLQDGRVRPVGGDVERTVDVRIIAASNKSLQDLVEAGEFREDLYYRLNVVEVRLPPLRERAGDLPLLCEHFLDQIAEREGRPRKRISREALARLARAPMPGNVRQLENILLNACVLVEGDVIGPDDLALGDGPTEQEVALDPAPSPSPAPPQSFDDFKQSEKQRILAALEAHDWNRARAARALGIPRRTFYRRLKEHGILP